MVLKILILSIPSLEYSNSVRIRLKKKKKQIIRERTFEFSRFCLGLRGSTGVNDVDKL